jgi:hypothetical protein
MNLAQVQPTGRPESEGLDLSGTSSGSGSSKSNSAKEDPDRGGFVSCCDDPASIKNNFSAELSVGVYCKSSSNGVQTRISILADLIIKNNPIVCEGNNLQAYLTIGGLKIAFRPWITFGTTRVSTDELILSQSQFDKIVNAASGGLTPIRAIIHGSLNSATSAGCRDKTLKSARVYFSADTPIKYVSWNENVTGSDQVQGPHCIGTQAAVCTDDLCPAKCCDCCAQVVDTGIRELVLAYPDENGRLYFTNLPCPGLTNVETRLYTDLFTCAFDCGCLEPADPTKRVPIFRPTASKRSISCERSKQTCYQCELVSDGCPPDSPSYGTSLFNTADILPLGTNLLSNHKSTIYKSV